MSARLSFECHIDNTIALPTVLTWSWQRSVMDGLLCNSFCLSLPNVKFRDAQHQLDPCPFLLPSVQSPNTRFQQWESVAHKEWLGQQWKRGRQWWWHNGGRPEVLQSWEASQNFHVLDHTAAENEQRGVTDLRISVQIVLAHVSIWDLLRRY